MAVNMTVAFVERIGCPRLPEVKIHSVVNREINEGIHPNILITSNRATNDQGDVIGFHYMQYHFSSPVNKDNITVTFDEKSAFSIITGIILREKYRNQGYGMSLYKNIIDKNNEIPVFSDIRLLNTNSKKMWDKLTCEGLAVPIIDSDMNRDTLGYLSIPKSQRNNYLPNSQPLIKEECRQILNLYESQMPKLSKIAHSN